MRLPSRASLCLVASAASRIETGLSSLGLPPARASALAAHAAATAMPSPGVLSRIAQMEMGIDIGVLTRAEAVQILDEQPEFLRLGFSTAAETDGLVCVAKPWDARLALDKAGPRWEHEPSLRDWLLAAHPTTATEAGDEVRICHQLDFATSGIIVAAKSREAANDVAKCFRERRARKLYLGLCFGQPAWEAVSWEQRIMVTQKKFKQRISGGGKKAHTEAAVAARGVLTCGEHAGREASLLWLQPRTGRRHQLRLHTSHAGHALVGDLTYADDRLMYRTFLHAAALELPLEHAPPLTVRAPLEPAGWRDVFEAREAPRDPEGWPGAAEALLS